MLEKRVYNKEQLSEYYHHQMVSYGMNTSLKEWDEYRKKWNAEHPQYDEPKWIIVMSIIFHLRPTEEELVAGLKALGCEING